MVRVLQGWKRQAAIALWASATIGAGVLQYQAATAAGGRMPTMLELDAELRGVGIPGEGPMIDPDGDPAPKRLHIRAGPDGKPEIVLVDKAPRGSLELGVYDAQWSTTGGLQHLRPVSETTHSIYPSAEPTDPHREVSLKIGHSKGQVWDSETGSWKDRPQ